MTRFGLVLALSAIALNGACHSTSGDGGVTRVSIGAQKVDFQSIADFLIDVQVQDLLTRAGLPVSVAADPPDLQGAYRQTLTVAMNDLPSPAIGTGSSSDIRFLQQQNGEIIVQREDGTRLSAFVSGEDDTFTIWFTDTVATFECNVVKAYVINGVCVDGALEFDVGTVIVGLHGDDCELLPGKVEDQFGAVQVSAGDAFATSVGAVVGDFGSIQDFLDNPHVQTLLTRTELQVHTGAVVPDVQGLYTQTATVLQDDREPGDEGETAVTPLCLFDQGIGRISLDSNGLLGLNMFIGGSADEFTIWAAVEVPFGGDLDCTGIEVLVITGKAQENRDVDIQIGSVTVGWHGTDCASLLGNLREALGLVAHREGKLEFEGDCP